MKKRQLSLDKERLTATGPIRIEGGTTLCTIVLAPIVEEPQSGEESWQSCFGPGTCGTCGTCPVTMPTTSVWPNICVGEEI